MSERCKTVQSQLVTNFPTFIYHSSSKWLIRIALSVCHQHLDSRMHAKRQTLPTNDTTQLLLSCTLFCANQCLHLGTSMFCHNLSTLCLPWPLSSSSTVAFLFQWSCLSALLPLRSELSTSTLARDRFDWRLCRFIASLSMTMMLWWHLFNLSQQSMTQPQTSSTDRGCCFVFRFSKHILTHTNGHILWLPFGCAPFWDSKCSMLRVDSFMASIDRNDGAENVLLALLAMAIVCITCCLALAICLMYFTFSCITFYRLSRRENSLTASLAATSELIKYWSSLNNAPEAEATDLVNLPTGPFQSRVQPMSIRIWQSYPTANLITK